MTLISTPTDVLLTPRRQRTRDRLLDAAYEVFAEQGVHASTVEEVCERAGFTRGAFYSNFTTKEELFAALMERQHSQQLAALAMKVDRLRPRLEAVTGPIDEAGLGDLYQDMLQRAIRAGRTVHDEPEARDTMVRLVLALTRPVGTAAGGPC